MVLTRLDRLLLRLAGVAAVIALAVYAWLGYQGRRKAQLLDAVDRGDARQVERLLNAGMDPNMELPERASSQGEAGALGGRLAERAIMEGRGGVAVILLRHGAILPKNRLTDIARIPGSRLLDYEIRAGEDPYQMLRSACDSGNAIQARYLLDRFPELERRLPTDPVEKAFLPAAAAAGYTDVVKLLIDAGADVNWDRLDFRTPLMHAARNGHAGVVKLLLAAGADVGYVDFRGQDALALARAGGHEDIVAELTRRAARAR